MIRAKPDIDAILADSDLVHRTVDNIGREEILRRKKLGLSVVIWRDGKVVVVPADEIPDDAWASQRV